MSTISAMSKALNISSMQRRWAYTKKILPLAQCRTDTRAQILIKIRHHIVDRAIYPQISHYTALVEY